MEKECLYKGLFKGKTCDEWVEGYFIKNEERYMILRCVGKNFISRDVVKDSVFQYIFLDDIAGNKIFDHDIVKIDDDEIGVVVYDEGAYYVYTTEQVMYPICELHTHKQLEVIGTYYEKPNWLGGFEI